MAHYDSQLEDNMFFVLGVTDENGPGQLKGPGTWEQCVAFGLKLIEELDGNPPAAEECTDFEQDGLRTKAKYGCGGVYYILGAESFEE